jgi:peptidoglycan biosynthesis protein MviN/MurJ (putative lipid II flippase)
MARIMFPFLLIVSLSAVAMGMLSSLRHFACRRSLRFSTWE